MSLTSCGALLGVFRVQTVLGAPWLVFSASARACSLERSSGYALRSRARPEAENPAPSCTLEKSATPWVESRTGALTVGSGGYSVAFASGLSPAPLSRFQSPLSEPDVRFSRISALQWDHASRTQVPARIRGRLPWVWHPSPTPSTSAPGVAARPVDALTTPSSSDDPFTFACDASGVSGPFTGVSGFRHSRDPSPFGHRSSPEAPSLHRHYPASPVLRASPPPCRPSLPLTGPVRCVPHHPQGFPCCTPSMRASVTTPAGPERCPRRSLPPPSSAFPISQVGRPPHCPFRGLLDVHSRSGPHVR